ncbi:MAG: DUF4293 domain-containing protein [Saprospiraceae bacterium]|nr:DUF4293 domain-containing protein [Saprospiraceae bacterium]
MIQRIQSIFLLLAAMAFGALLAFPMASTPTAGTDLIFADQEYTVQDNVALLILTIAGLVLALAAIFLYGKRSLQLRLSYLLIVICIVLPLVAYLFFTNQASVMSAEQSVHDELGLFLPFVGLICVILAARFIRKDDRLVKSMDRLR